jgi:hypothetical protein
VSLPTLTLIDRAAVSISTVACAARAIAMCRAALNIDSISVAAPYTFTLSRTLPAHGMAMARSMLRMQSVTVSSIKVNARRTCPSV